MFLIYNKLLYPMPVNYRYLNQNTVQFPLCRLISPAFISILFYYSFFVCFSYVITLKLKFLYSVLIHLFSNYSSLTSLS